MLTCLQHAPLPHPLTGGITFTTFDLGGHRTARRVWKDYFPAVDAIVFIIDTKDRPRFEESSVELAGLMAEEQVAKGPSQERICSAGRLNFSCALCENVKATARVSDGWHSILIDRMVTVTIFDSFPIHACELCCVNIRSVSLLFIIIFRQHTLRCNCMLNNVVLCNLFPRFPDSFSQFFQDHFWPPFYVAFIRSISNPGSF